MAKEDQSDMSLAAMAEPIDTADLAQSAKSVEVSDQTNETTPTAEDKAKPGPIPYERFHEKNEDWKAERDARLRLEGEIAAERARAAQLAADLEASRRQPTNQTAANPGVVTGRFTADDLENGVIEGKWTRAQVIDYERETARIIAQNAATAAFQEQSRVQPILTNLSKYQEVLPDMYTPGSPTNAKVVAEFNRLVRDFGMPSTKATELIALERAFGPVDTIKTAQRSRDLTATERDTHREGGSGQTGKVDQSKGTKDPWESLPNDQKDIYRDLIRRGVYNSINEVREELKSAAENPFNESLREQTRELLAR